MRYYLDEEFIERGPDYPIELISIGIVAEDGRELYLQSTEFNIDKASSWVRENVIMHLDPCPSILTNPPYSLGTLYGAQSQHKKGQCVDPQRGIFLKCPWRTREELRDEVLSFMDTNKYGWPELWSWCGAYDFVAFCQLFGTMMDLPPGYPHYIRDLQQVLDERGISDEELPEQEEGLHYALQDARHLKRLWGYIVRNDCWQ